MDENQELKSEQFIYELFIMELKKIGYGHNYFLNDFFDMNLVDRPRPVKSNYIKKQWLEYLNKNKTDKINVYIGMPYCYGKCAFCIYHKKIAKNPQQVSRYAKALTSQIHFFKEILQDRKFHNLYFGGGTPSLFSEEDLKLIFSAFFQYTRFLDTSEKSFECNPQSTTYGKLKILKEYDFNRISLGVQSLTKKALKSINRDYQSKKEVMNSIKYCKKLDFEQYSVDLILGLHGETQDSFVKSFKQIMSLKPTAIRLYRCQPTENYLKYFDNSIKKFDTHYNKMKKVVPKIIKYAKKQGYKFTGAHVVDAAAAAAMSFELRSAKKIPDTYHFNADFKGSVFGLGFHSNSYIKNRIRYYITPPLRDNGENNQFNLIEFSEKKEILLTIFEEISKQSEISQNFFEETFGEPIWEVFADPLEKLKKLGHIDVEKDLIKFKKDSRERFLAGLFFIGKDKIKNAINDYYNDNLIKIEINGNRLIYKIDFEFRDNSTKPKVVKVLGNYNKSRIYQDLQDIIYTKRSTENPVQFREELFKDILCLFNKYKRQNRSIKLQLSKKPLRARCKE